MICIERGKERLCVCVHIYIERDRQTDREKQRQQDRERQKECMSVYVCIYVCMYLLGEIYTHYWFCTRTLTHTEMVAKASSSL